LYLGIIAYKSNKVINATKGVTLGKKVLVTKALRTQYVKTTCGVLEHRKAKAESHDSLKATLYQIDYI